MEPEDHTFSEAAASYIRAGGETKYLERIIGYFGDRLLKTLHPYDIREMAEILYPSHSAATRNRQAITPARAVMLHAYERGWCPAIRVRSFQQERPQCSKPASALWLQVFCRQADRDGLGHVAALVLFMATTGARVSEAVALRWSEVDLAAKTATLLKTKTSTNSVRHLSDDVAERIRRLEAHRGRDDRVFGYTSRFSVGERIRAICARAEIPYKSPHVCGRHTFATAAIESGVDIGTAMAVGEWKSSKVFLETYVHPRSNAGRVTADKLAQAFSPDL